MGRRHHESRIHFRTPDTGGRADAGADPGVRGEGDRCRVSEPVDSAAGRARVAAIGAVVDRAGAVRVAQDKLEPGADRAAVLLHDRRKDRRPVVAGSQLAEVGAAARVGQDPVVMKGLVDRGQVRFQYALFHSRQRVRCPNRTRQYSDSSIGAGELAHGLFITADN